MKAQSNFSTSRRLNLRLYALMITAILSIPTAFGQKNAMKWGNISKAELAMTSYEQDPEADAVVLSDYGTIIYDVDADRRPLLTERIVRVKLLTQAGVESYGDVSIPYYSYGNSTVLGGLKGRVYLLNGEKINVPKSNIFTEKTSEYWSQEKISFPSLEPGAIIEYRYNIHSTRLFTPVDWFFQRDIPVAYGELNIEFPEWFEYVSWSQNQKNVKETTEIVSRNIDYVQSSNLSTTKGNLAGIPIEVRFNRWKFVTKNMPALKEERFITTMDDYYSRVRFQLRSYKFPNGPRTQIMHSWNEVAKNMRESTSFGKMYMNERQGRKILESAGINPESMSESEVVVRLYDYVGNNIVWDDMYSVYSDGSASEALKRGTASSGELNLVLLCALRAAGIDANPVITSTRSKGKLFEPYPYLAQFNHTFVTAMIDDKIVNMDVSNGLRPVGLLSVSSLNYRGWLIKDDSQQWIGTEAPISKSSYYFKLKYDEETGLYGTINTRMSGYHAYKHRNDYKKDKDAYFKSYLVSGADKITIDSVVVENAKNLYKKFEATINIEIENLGSGDFLYISPPLKESLLENPFSEPERSYPVEFAYSQEEQYILELDVPEGYAVEPLPEGIKMSSEDGGLVLSRYASVNQGKVQMRIKLTLTKLRYTPDEYPVLRNFYDQVIQKMGEQIVFKKID